MERGQRLNSFPAAKLDSGKQIHLFHVEKRIAGECEDRPLRCLVLAGSKGDFLSNALRLKIMLSALHAALLLQSSNFYVVGGKLFVIGGLKRYKQCTGVGSLCMEQLSVVIATSTCSPWQPHIAMPVPHLTI